MKSEEAKNLLMSDDGRPSPQYKAYLEFLRFATEKKREMSDAKQLASQDFNVMRNWPITAKNFNDELQQAMEKWVVLGYKNEIERAINVLKAEGQDTSFLKIE